MILEFQTYLSSSSRRNPQANIMTLGKKPDKKIQIKGVLLTQNYMDIQTTQLTTL
jgi:hypothetical protein